MTQPPHRADTYRASAADGVSRPQRQLASAVSDTERIHRILFSHYDTPLQAPHREHGSNR